MTEDALGLSRQWVERFVVGLGLCPFAARPMALDRVRFALSPGSDRDSIYRGFLAEVQRLLNTPPARLETTLYVVPQGLAEFAAYLDLLGLLEHALTEAGLDGVLQIAGFHPAYCFAGAAADDPANWTNRSPLPMFHLIREARLSAALAGFPDPEGIPLRNIEHLRRLGVEGIQALLGSN